MTGSSCSPYSRRSVRSDAAPSPSPPLAFPNPHPDTQAELTLMQLFVWSHDPLQRLTTLAQLVRGTSKLKGGAMTVAIERLRRHGDPAVAGHVSHLLKRACEPLFGMLRRWLLHGELDDPHDEFFIESCAPRRPRAPSRAKIMCTPPTPPTRDPHRCAPPTGRCAVPLARMWRERYRLREAMLPSFVPTPLALEILKARCCCSYRRRLSCCRHRTPFATCHTGWQDRQPHPPRMPRL